MDLFVAGLPNSGTTYVAHLLQRAGVEFGSDVWPHSLHRKGMEWLPVRDWYLKMFDTVMGSADPSPAVFGFGPNDRRAYWDEHPPPENPPPALKVPDFNVHRLDIYYRPDTVLKVVRPKDGWVASMTKWRPGCGGKHEMLGEVYDYVLGSLPGDVTVEWPRCVRDTDYMVETLSPFAAADDLMAAYETVTKPEWVTFG